MNSLLNMFNNRNEVQVSFFVTVLSDMFSYN